MKAAYLRTTGAPDVIEVGELPEPEPKAGEVLIRVSAVSLNPIDTYIRAGTVKMQLPQPYIVGSDLAGTVESIGSGVTRFKVGDRVWGSNQGLLGRQGACAELVNVHEDWLYPTPDGVSDETAAAGALVGITAHLGLFRFARLQKGETVFVNGGTGGVGSMVVQMTHAVGGKAICTVGTEEKAKTCREMGVEHVINYKTEDVPARIKGATGDQGVDVWYETQRSHDFEKIIGLMRQRGRMIVMAGRASKPDFPVGPFYVKDLSLFGFAMFNASPDEQRECADDMNRWYAEKKVAPLIGATFPLAETAQAHKVLEENTMQGGGELKGKVVISIN